MYTTRRATHKVYILSLLVMWAAAMAPKKRPNFFTGVPSDDRNIVHQLTRGVGNREPITNGSLARYLGAGSDRLAARFAEAGDRDLAGVGYGSWRRIRGDGNCFYRSVIIAALEQGNEVRGQLFEGLFNATEEAFDMVDLDPEATVKPASRQDMNNWLSNQLGNADGVKNLTGYTAEIDLALVRAARALTIDWLLRNKDERDVQGGLTNEEAIQMAEGYANMERYCYGSVAHMGRETQSELEQKALAAALRLSLRIVDLRKGRTTFGNDTQLQNMTFPRSGIPADIHILRTPGHYSMLQPMAGAPPRSRSFSPQRQPEPIRPDSPASDPGLPRSDTSGDEELARAMNKPAFDALLEGLREVGAEAQRKHEAQTQAQLRADRQREKDQQIEEDAELAKAVAFSMRTPPMLNPRRVAVQAEEPQRRTDIRKLTRRTRARIQAEEAEQRRQMAPSRKR